MPLGLTQRLSRSPAGGPRRTDGSTRPRTPTLADRDAGRDHPAGRRPAEGSAGVDQYGLSSRERGALGLVLFGGLGYAQTSRELAIPPSDMAALLRAALHGLATAAAGLAHSRLPATMTSAAMAAMSAARAIRVA
jgi:hypothetical protein